jgi:hypothetical protein
MFHRRWGRGYEYENTRQHVRLRAPWPVKCEPRSPGAGSYVTTAQDVGAGGIGVILPVALPLGSRLNVELHVTPLDRTIRVEAEVASARPQRGGFYLGIRFIQPDPPLQQVLRETIDQFFPPRKQRRHQGSWWRKIG